MDISPLIPILEKRIYRDEWRVGWFQSDRDVDIDGYDCKLLMYGHSRHFSRTKPFLLSRLFTINLLPYSAAAMIFQVDYIDISYIEGLIKAIKRFMASKKIETPEKIEWGIDIAYVAVFTEEMGRGVEDYINDFFISEIDDQYMLSEGFSGKLKKKIGLVLVNLSDKKFLRGRDMFSKEAVRLFDVKRILKKWPL
jgi:hypothetical protein